MSEPKGTEPQRDRDRGRELARRNLRTALWLALLACSFVAAFFLVDEPPRSLRA